MKRLPGQRQSPQVSLDDPDPWLPGEAAAHHLGEPRIALDGDDAGSGARERRGQRAKSGAEVEYQVTGADVALPHDLGDQDAVSQEVRAARVRRSQHQP